MDIPYWLIGVAAVVALALAIRPARIVFARVAVVIGLGLFVWFVVIPWALNLRTIEGIGRGKIHANALRAADEATSGMSRGEFPEESRFREHEKLQGRTGRTFYRLSEAEKRGIAEMHGANFGDFTFFPRIVRPSPASWSQPFKERVDGTKVPIQVCAPYGVLTVQGTVNAGKEYETLDVESGAPGWPTLIAETWEDFQTVEPEAPFMALLIRVGANGQPRWDWTPVGEGKFQMVLRRESGCASLYYAYNHVYIGPNGGEWTDSFAGIKGEIIGWLVDGK